MILPIGDTPNPTGRAWANWLLLAANVAVFAFLSVPLLMTSASADDVRVLTATFGALPYVPSAYEAYVVQAGFQTSDPSMLDLLRSLFLHSGVGHLLGNLLFLWIYGDNVESRMGSVPYLVFYLACGVAATGAYAALAGPSPVPLIGASGAISGVLGAYLVWFPYNRVKLLVGLWPIWVDLLLVPAWIVLSAYVLLDNVLPLVLGADSQVAYGAHLGGFFAGLMVAAIARRRIDAPDPVNGHLVEGRAALETGDLPRAYQHLMVAWRRGGPDTSAEARRLLETLPDPRLRAWLSSRPR